MRTLMGWRCPRACAAPADGGDRMDGMDDGSKTTETLLRPRLRALSLVTLAGLSTAALALAGAVAPAGPAAADLLVAILAGPRGPPRRSESGSRPAHRRLHLFDRHGKPLPLQGSSEFPEIHRDRFQEDLVILRHQELHPVARLQRESFPNGLWEGHPAPGRQCGCRHVLVTSGLDYDTPPVPLRDVPPPRKLPNIAGPKLPTSYPRLSESCFGLTEKIRLICLFSGYCGW